MKKYKYIIFDLDWTLIESMSDTIKLIINHLSKIPETDIEKAEYIFSTTAWMPLRNQIEIIYKDLENIDTDLITSDIYKSLLSHDAEFFEWIPEKIKELKNNYKLFLTTWNSTQVANKHLIKWWIKEHFELVYWSDIILKWKEHLELFKEHSWDDDFFKNSVYVGDWHSDRKYAKEAWIDFIHIWDENIDKYEIKTVKDINDILNKF